MLNNFSWFRYTDLLLMSMCLWSPHYANTVKERNLFATELFQNVALENLNKNVVLSPVSVQTALALVYYGAGGNTAAELQTALHETADQSELDLAHAYQDLLNAVKKSMTKLDIANKIFVNRYFELSPNFKKIAQEYFYSDAESLDFANKTYAVQHINQWISDNTNGKIDKVIEEIDAFDNALLINAIHFKADWSQPFMARNTKERDFWLSNDENIKVPTMFAERLHFYAEYPELDAKGLELFFANDELSMWFILPNKRDGLDELEQKLKGRDLNTLQPLFKRERVSVYLPIFKYEFDIDLIPTLKKVSKRFFE